MIRVDSDNFMTLVCPETSTSACEGLAGNAVQSEVPRVSLAVTGDPNNRGKCGSEKASYNAQEGRCCRRCSGRRPLRRIWPLRASLRSHSRSSGGCGCSSDGWSSSRRSSSAEARDSPCRGGQAEQVHLACSIHRPTRKHTYLHALAASFVWRPAGASCHMASVLAVLSLTNLAEALPTAHPPYCHTVDYIFRGPLGGPGVCLP